MKLKTLTLTLACIGGIGLSVPALASYGFTNVGDITGALTTGDLEFYANGLVPIIPGSFEYDFFFQTTVDYFGLGVVADLPSIGSKYNINNLAAYLYSDLGTVAVADLPDLQLDLIGTGDYIAGGGQLGAGSYYFRIIGDAVGTQGGQFSYSASAVPVPDAETWAMMAMGLGLVSLRLRRHKSRKRIA